MTRYDARTALLVVDVQNDFADAKGSLSVGGGDEIVEPINAEIAAARAAGALVVYTQDWHPQHTPHFETEGGPWPVHCVQGSWGAAFHPDLHVEGEALQKGAGGEDGYSGFSVRDPRSGDRASTLLEALLHEHGVRRLVIVGLATDYCVKESALDAVRLGLEAVVLGESVRAVDLQPGDGERALEALRAAGVTIE